MSDALTKEPPVDSGGGFPWPLAMRHRNFRLYISGQSISLIGTWMQATVIQWIAYEIWRREDYLGILGFVSQIPHLIIAPMAGAILDRHSRHRVLFATQILAMIQAVALALCTAFGHMEFSTFLLLAVFLGIINAVDMPCRQSFVVEMVGRDAMSSGIAINSFVFNLARIIGPIVAIELLQWLGPSRVFGLNAVSFLIILWFLALIRPTRHVQPHEPGDMLEKIRDALLFVRKEAALREPLLYIGVISFAGFSIQVLMPAIADKIFNAGPGGFRNLLTAVGVGGVIGAVTVMRISRPETLIHMIPICGICFGTGLILMSFQTSINIALMLMAPSGAAMMILPLCTNTYLQKHVPEGMRGRVMSFYTMMLLGLVPFGNLAAGWIARHIGLVEAVRHGAFWCILGGVIFLMRTRRIELSARRLEALHHAPIKSETAHS